MKRIYILLVLAIMTSFNMMAITYTTNANGSWVTPSTWSPLGVPIPGDIVIINHDVTLDTDFAYTVGSITVNSGGSLIEDSTPRSVWVNGVGAALTNNGTTTINTLLISDGAYTNTGIFTVKIFANFAQAVNLNTGLISGVDSIYNDGTLVNEGQINVMAFYNDDTWNNYGKIFGLTTIVDSMYNAGIMLNDVTAIIKADSCTNSGQFVNNGIINYDQFTNIGTFTNTNYMSFVDMTNKGTYTNKDSLIGAGSLTNTGDLDNQAGAQFDLAISFLNADPVSFNAVFNADGRFVIGDSFYNFDGITGDAPGSIQCADTSYNHSTGTMTGTFDFCDLSTPAVPPVDFNLGSISGTITYCTITDVEKKLVETDNKIYPNPTTGLLNVEVEDGLTIDIYNVLGEIILTTKNSRIDISTYQDGIYFVLIKDDNGETIIHEKIIKQ